MMTARRPNLRTNRRGATALLFGLAALPLIAIVALAVDFGAAASAKAKLDLAADASALTTVMSASNVYANNPLAVLTPAISDGRDRFRAQIGSINGVTLQPIDVQVTRDGSKFTSVVSYAAQYATSFAGIIGSATIPISGSAEAIITTGPYVDVEVLLDNSSSMLIGATMDDINRLLAATKPSKGPFPYPSASWGWEPCAFACHWDPGNRDFYSLTRNPANNIRLRLDQLKSAVDTIVRAIAAKNRPLYRFGLYTFYLDVAKNYPASALNADILNLDMGAAALAATDAVGPPAPANLSDEYNRP
jgi:Flp pilus assembly protein TadG